jgi:hypothetical protein
MSSVPRQLTVPPFRSSSYLGVPLVRECGRPAFPTSPLPASPIPRCLGHAGLSVAQLAHPHAAHDRRRPGRHGRAVARMISEATEHYAVRLPLPERLTDTQLRGLRMPVYAALAGRSIMHNGAHAADVAEPRSQTRRRTLARRHALPTHGRNRRAGGPRVHGQPRRPNAQIYPRGSGELVTWSWQRPASQAARVSWMSRRVWLSAVI